MGSLCRNKRHVALKVVKSAQHYTETARDEIDLLKKVPSVCVATVVLCLVLCTCVHQYVWLLWYFAWYYAPVCISMCGYCGTLLGFMHLCAIT